MVKCPICITPANFLTKKSDRFGQEYSYFMCGNCRFLFEQDLVFDRKKLAEKVGKLYGGDYFNQVDQGWQGRGDAFLRTIKKVIALTRLFKKNPSVLDYGGGNGYIAAKLADQANVSYYDKYEKPSFKGKYEILDEPKKADIMYAVELVEHLVDMREWDFLKEFSPGVFVFTTCLSDNIPTRELADWIYLNPDAGHVSLHSTKSLSLLAKKYGYLYFFFPNIFTHIFIKSKFLSRFDLVAIEYSFYNLVRRLIK